MKQMLKSKFLNA